MTKVAVVLSGCGHLDGAEIRESVLALLYLDKQNADVRIFAPDIAQAGVVDHRAGKPVAETRNVLTEAARIARGKIQPLSELDAKDFDALVLPGGFGAAKNLSNLAAAGERVALLPDFKRVVQAFQRDKKPIGAICISPAVLAAALSGVASPEVTVGDDAGVAGVIEKLGGRHKNCATDQAVVDKENRIATCSAYMRDDRLANIAAGIEKVIDAVMTMARERVRSAA